MHVCVKHGSTVIENDVHVFFFQSPDVFKKAIPLGRFFAVFSTFALSSLLHVSISWNALVYNSVENLTDDEAWCNIR